MILIVEDDDATRYALARLMRTAGFHGALAL
jgi:FixJ family two-component response regulator